MTTGCLSVAVPPLMSCLLVLVLELLPAVGGELLTLAFQLNPIVAATSALSGSWLDTGSDLCSRWPVAGVLQAVAGVLLAAGTKLQTGEPDEQRRASRPAAAPPAATAGEQSEPTP